MSLILLNGIGFGAFGAIILGNFFPLENAHLLFAIHALAITVVVATNVLVHALKQYAHDNSWLDEPLTYAKKEML